MLSSALLSSRRYTWYGKIICTCTMFCGILVLALPIMIIGNSFEEVFTEEVQQKARRVNPSPSLLPAPAPPSLPPPRLS